MISEFYEKNANGNLKKISMCIEDNFLYLVTKNNLIGVLDLNVTRIEFIQSIIHKNQT